MFLNTAMNFDWIDVDISHVGIDLYTIKIHWQCWKTFSITHYQVTAVARSVVVDAIITSEWWTTILEC